MSTQTHAPGKRSLDYLEIRDLTSTSTASRPSRASTSRCYKADCTS